MTMTVEVCLLAAGRTIAAILSIIVRWTRLLLYGSDVVAPVQIQARDAQQSRVDSER